jgi:hypothetical protein
MLQECIKPSFKSLNSSIFSNNLKNTLRWAPKCQKALSSQALLELVKLCLPEPVLDKLEFHFTTFQDLILLKNMWV